MSRIVIAHGGVDVPLTRAYQATVERAALAGAAALAQGRLDAVEATIRLMEDDPAFNAGSGSVLNRDGVVEMDALIIDGVSGKAGAVAAIQQVANPISVARRILDATPHVLLAGAGASLFAREQGFPAADCETEAQRAAWQRMRECGSLSELGLNPFTGQPDPTGALDTVGCVARTDDGTAAGVSTGGLFFKHPGRIGDSAIVGAGAYAARAGAVACSGLGEAFHELLLAERIGSLLQEVHPQRVVEDALHYLWEQRQGVGGVIAVDAHGRIGIAHNGRSLAAAVVIDGQPIAVVPVKLATGS